MGLISLRNVAVSVEERCVHLEGQVDTYYAKQLAQNAVLKVEGVERVINELDVE